MGGTWGKTSVTSSENKTRRQTRTDERISESWQPFKFLGENSSLSPSSHRERPEGKETVNASVRARGSSDYTFRIQRGRSRTGKTLPIKAANGNEIHEHTRQRNGPCATTLQGRKGRRRQSSRLVLVRRFHTLLQGKKEPDRPRKGGDATPLREEREERDGNQGEDYLDSGLRGGKLHERKTGRHNLGDRGGMLTIPSREGKNVLDRGATEGTGRLAAGFA